MEMREQIARIICCFAKDNNCCAECEKNDPEMKYRFPDCFVEIRTVTDQLITLNQQVLSQALKEQHDRIFKGIEQIANSNPFEPMGKLQNSLVYKALKI